MVNQHTIKRPVFRCACGDHAFVSLTRGYVALMDVDDAAFISQWSWSCLALPSGHFRAVRRENGARRFFYMHREILGTNAPEVDHINGWGLDNRRSNLRACSRRQNGRNQRPQRRRTSSKFKGVYFDAARDKWQAYINVDGKRHRLGRFDNAADAARAYDEKASELHGAFARTNASLGLFP